MIKSLDHVGLGVSNIERSLDFYRDFLGMEVLMELDITDVCAVEIKSRSYSIDGILMP